MDDETGYLRGGGIAAAAQRRSILEDVLRKTVISRLYLAHPQVIVSNPGPDSEVMLAEDPVDSLIETLRHGNQGEVDRDIGWLIESGCGLEALLLDVIPAVEARLQPVEESDARLALWRLQELVERLSLPDLTLRHERRAVLVSAEPAAFRLRLLIAAGALHADGWDSASETELGFGEIPALMTRDYVVLLVVAAEHCAVEPLAALIRAARRASTNPHMRVLVLSAPLVRRPDRLVRLGADAAAGDIRQARLQARRLLALMPPAF